jgi:hypothetical protein
MGLASQVETTRAAAHAAQDGSAGIVERRMHPPLPSFPRLCCAILIASQLLEMAAND